MKRMNFLKVTAAVALSVMMVFVIGCTDKDYYNPNEGQEEPKSIDEYFDFSTRANVQVNINYGYPGYRAFFSIYAENPVGENGLTLRKDVQALYSAFTTSQNTFNSTVSLPAGLKKVYLYTSAYALPTVVELNVVASSIGFDNSSATNQTRAGETAKGDCLSVEGNVWQVAAGVNLYRLYNSIGNNNTPSNTNVTGLYSPIAADADISSTSTPSTIGGLLERAQAVLGDPGADPRQNNSSLVEENTNISIKEKTTEGKDVESAHVDLVFLNSNPGSYKNVMGYYYYKTGETLTASMIKDLPKYLLFPKLEKDKVSKPNPGIKVRLQFFGENYNEEGTDDFPAGYSIGWILIPNTGTDSYTGTTTNSFNNIHNKIVSTYKTTAIYSNYFANNQKRQGFISLKDAVSGKILIGIEDTSWENHHVKQPNDWYTDSSYEDLLFYVDADPIEAIYDDDDKIIEEDEILRTETTYGTLAFEDIWPTGGDYDMNDVVVEYSSAVTFNQDNEIKKIVDTFKPVHDGATYKNGFGYVINSALGEINADESNFSVKEENNQFILFPNAKEVQGQSFTLTREFAEGSYPSKPSYVRNYNPFIVVHYEAGKKNRTEVHLPKTNITSWADPSQVGDGDEAYFIDKDGTHPFAIDLPLYTGGEAGKYKVPVETTSISVAYPDFDGWVNSKGSSNADWYKKPAEGQVQD